MTSMENAGTCRGTGPTDPKDFFIPTGSKPPRLAWTVPTVISVNAWKGSRSHPQLCNLTLTAATATAPNSRWIGAYPTDGPAREDRAQPIMASEDEKRQWTRVKA